MLLIFVESHLSWRFSRIFNRTISLVRRLKSFTWLLSHFIFTLNIRSEHFIVLFQFFFVIEDQFSCVVFESWRRLNFRRLIWNVTIWKHWMIQFNLNLWWVYTWRLRMINRVKFVIQFFNLILFLQLYDTHHVASTLTSDMWLKILFCCHIRQITNWSSRCHWRIYIAEIRFSFRECIWRLLHLCWYIKKSWSASEIFFCF